MKQWIYEFSNGGRVSIYVDGNISSGKSTLCSLLEEECAAHVTTIAYPEMGHEGATIEIYLRNKTQLSPMFQAHMLSMCDARETFTTLHTTLVPDAPKLVIVDRSVTGNGVFAVTNRLFTDSLGDKEMEFYTANYEKAMRRAKGVPFAHGTLSVYLHAEVSDSIRRCLKRSRDIEASSYDTKYFEHLECMAMLALLANLSLDNPHPQLVLDWCDDTEDPCAKFDAIMSSYMAVWSPVSAPTRVRLARTFPTSVPSSSSPSSSSSSEEEGEEEEVFTSVLDLSGVHCEYAFFSYANVRLMFNSIVCNAGAGDRFSGINACIVVPECLTTRPFGSLFELKIHD